MNIKHLEIRAAEGGDDAKLLVDMMTTAYLKFADNCG